MELFGFEARMHYCLYFVAKGSYLLPSIVVDWHDGTMGPGLSIT